MSPSTLLRKFLSLTVAHGMLCIGAAAAAATPLIAVGGDPAGSDYGYRISGLIPPNSDGAAGSDRLFAELQGVYLVYDETGAVPQRSPTPQLWSSARITPSFLSDPRVRYDPASGQWLAAEPGSPSAVFLAAANMPDPEQGGSAVSLTPDPDSSVDFSRPDIDWDAVHISGSDINIASSHGIGNRNALIAPLSSDPRGATPSAVNATVFSNSLQNQTGVGLPPNGAVQLPGAEPVLPAFNAAGVGTRLNIAPVTSTTLDTAQRAMTLSPGTNTDSAIPQDTTVANNTGPASFNSGAALHKDRLPRVPAMHPANPAFPDGSASINPLGGVGLGSSGSGARGYPGADAPAGAVAGSTPTLGDPRPLQTGMAPYQPGANPAVGSGDYGAAALDSGQLPNLSTIQGWESGFDPWSTGISGTAFDAQVAVPEPSSLLVLGIGVAGLLLVRKRGIWPMRQASSV